MALWNGRPGWLSKLGLILLIAWLIVLIISVFHVMKSNPSLDNRLTNEKDNARKLSDIMKNFEILKKQNDALANFLTRDNSKIFNSAGNLNDKQKIVIDAMKNVGNNENGPSLEYEELRRKVKNNVKEMWYYFNAELDKVKKYADDFPLDKREKDIDDAIKNTWEHKKSLMNDLDKLMDADGHGEWREKESRELSDLVQRRFYHLQNPSDCNTAKKLTCSLNKGCGFGCQIHHLTYCFLVAYGTERTLILKSKGWRYHKDGWESVFKPLSDTCQSAGGSSHSNWPGDATKQVVSLPFVDNVYPKPIYQPPSIPADLAPRIQKIHGHPIVWWVGQVLKFLMRPQDNIKNVIDYSRDKLGFEKPIVGVHVRRTDKVGTEAAFHDIDEYMVKVDQYFNQLEVEPTVRRVFIASDDPKVILTARKRYTRYEIIGDPTVAETASVSKRYSDSSLHGIIVDINLLSMSDHLVCTFSSQVCRVAYELMQTYHIDAYDKFTSLDDSYYYGGQNANPYVAILDHVPRRVSEIELRIGDKIEVHGNHWDGYSKGRNMRSGVTGLFPSFKVKNPVAVADFPKYPQVPLVSDEKLISTLRCTQRKYGTERKSNTYYEILQVPNDATKKDIRLAFLKLSKEMHPDKSSKGDKASHDDFIKINEAYNILSKDDSRREYDSALLYNNNRYKTTFRPSNETVYYYRDSMWHDLRTHKSRRKYRFSNEGYYRTAKNYNTNQYHNKIAVLCIIIFLLSSAIQAALVSSGSAYRLKRIQEQNEKYMAEYNIIRSEAIELTRNDSIDVLSNKILKNRKNEEINEKR
ncbi:hypothetical protein PV325_000136 [Microctonus aethiopoides]|nr:hypothetical protein PV325_000136 [Microctonus aethiopoides]